MVLNYIKLAVRLQLRNPFFTFINLLGLSVGFAVFFVLWLHSDHELSSDTFRKDHDKIYRLYFDFYHNQGAEWAHYLCGAFSPVFASIAREKFTEIESSTRIIHQTNFDEVRWRGPQTDTAGWAELDKTVTISFLGPNQRKHFFVEEQVIFADENLFEFFSIPLVSGNPHRVLSEAGSVAISSSLAAKYFGNEAPLGKTIVINDTSTFVVSGVFEDIPRNSHLRFEIVLSSRHIANALQHLEPFQRSAQIYFKIRDGVNVDQLTARLNDEHKKYWSFKEWEGASLTVFLQPLRDVSFRVFDNDPFIPKSRYLQHTFQSIALVVLLMAWINYVNLTISKRRSRMKELAARKSAGATRTDFLKQFFLESFVMNIVALIAALTLIQVFRSPLELVFQFHIPGWDAISPAVIITFAGIMLLGLLLTSVHPALFTWRVTTQQLLSIHKLPQERLRFSHVATVAQFVGAIALIVWVYIVSAQLDYVINDDWGLDRSGVVIIELPESEVNDYSRQVNALKDEIINLSHIEDVTVSSVIAGDLNENAVGITTADSARRWAVPKSDGGVDERFIPFYNLKILTGRNFIKDHPADHRSVILSRIAAANIGYSPEEAIGKKVVVERYSWRPFGSTAEIIGVIEDHRLKPLYNESGMANANSGLILTYGNHLFVKSKARKMSIRIDNSDLRGSIQDIQLRFHRWFPAHVFSWYFLDEFMNAHYTSERYARNQILLFTVVGICIACLGLLGLVSNRMTEKTKEIGIRRILGATLKHIVSILLATSLRHILISTAIGIPVAFLLAHHYLEKFSEKITLAWWHFGLPVIMLLLIMIGSISGLLWKAACTSPVDSLRYE